MVIRKLQPSIKIQLPTKPVIRRSKGKIVRRRLADYPPPTPQETPCVLWQGTIDNHGYGTWWRWTDDRGWVKTRPHRWVMERVMGRPLFYDEVVIHACDNRICYRVEHLRVGNVAENNADMMAKGRYVHAGGRPRGRPRNPPIEVPPY